MKKIVSLLLILALTASLAACALPGAVSIAQPGIAAAGIEQLLGGKVLHATGGSTQDPAADPGDRVYYGYSMYTEGMEINLIEYMEFGLDPRDFCLILRADGTGMLYMGDETGVELTWTDSELISEGEGIPYTMEGDHLTLSIGDESMTFIPAAEMEALLGGASVDPLAQVRAYWAGDWYGFWVMEKRTRTGDYASWEENWWDACVRITVNDDGTGHLVVYDEDGGNFTFLAACDVAFAEGTTAAGKMTSTGGNFWGQDLSNGAWMVDPALTDVAEHEHMITFESEFADKDGSFAYYYILRPWGMDWSDISEEGYPGLPYYYDSWYLPLVQKGESCPFDFAE